MGKGKGSRRRRRAISKRLAANMPPLDPGVAVACHYCKGATSVGVAVRGAPHPPDMRTRDHVVPAALGGLDKPWNIVIACLLCNESRSRGPLGVPACSCEFCTMAWKLHRAVGHGAVTRGQGDRLWCST